MVASAYGLTPDQFFSFTPRQIQMVAETLRIRLHNEKVMQIKLHRGKADFIDPEMERSFRVMRAQRTAGKLKDIPPLEDIEKQVGKNG